MDSMMFTTTDLLGPGPSVLEIDDHLELEAGPSSNLTFSLGGLLDPAPTISSTESQGNLLQVPIHRMLDELSLSTASKLDGSNQKANQTHVNPDNDFTLWCDRYRPQKFTELVGNERVAREVMTWVKQWDWCVFGRRKAKKRTKDEEQSDEPVDEFHRPRERILLLSGPPGLGKTTLAHIVASQAGYDALEINASDARSGQVVDDRIRSALEAGSMLGGNKPTMLILDEVDGATGAGENANSFIAKLIQLTTDRPRRKKNSGKNGKAQTQRPILRPIICICNDINASALTKLRQHSLQVRMTRPADVHVVKRLREICELERLKADSRALTALVGVTRGDLRGCLNTLQFIKSRNEDVTENVIRRATLGMKESETSITSILNDLFSPLSKKRVKELGLTEEEEGHYVSRLCHDIDACGRDISIAIGCFSHYATLRQHDANFTRYESANSWLGTYDLFSSAMYSDGDFSLRQYLPYTLVPFHALFHERGGRVERSQDDWEPDTDARQNQKITQTNQEIYQSISRGLRIASARHHGAYRHFVEMPMLQLELAPYINRIISPPIRPINSQVIKAGERALLSRLVSIMAALELRFVQERAEDGQLTYRLDPPVDVFITYDGKRANDIPASRYAVRHLVAGEVDNLLFAINNDVIEKGKRGKHDFSGSTRTDENGDQPPSKRFKADHTDIVDRPPTDFFGRPITTPSAGIRKVSGAKVLEKKFRIAFKYAEGNSAAVRKPVKVSSFL
ncbi:P-loop containing nucleoside triphosphate hydrolase protein [Pluteus cervinus]|uniref:P-loop containing nucleoside triphosphate hydrolase protein n=1 Tax=Pluteus cervinus TaxID=181527 RepID=A0ACD3BCX6_9AGAR|nr:P-loop containing nucleoside triphosphate hydrolase protein [Pluteus cervinus]